MGEQKKLFFPFGHIGRKNLDFGQGFYVTDLKEQAARWALATAKRRNAQAVINSYQLNRNAIIAEYRCKIFDAYDKEWLDFIAASRRGMNPALSYDYIEGGVANDRVIDTVNLYMTGLVNAETALQRLSLHSPNNQMCLLKQSIVNQYLIHETTESIE